MRVLDTPIFPNSLCTGLLEELSFSFERRTDVEPFDDRQWPAGKLEGLRALVNVSSKACAERGAAQWKLQTLLAAVGGRALTSIIGIPFYSRWAL